MKGNKLFLLVLVVLVIIVVGYGFHKLSKMNGRADNGAMSASKIQVVAAENLTEILLVNLADRT